MAINWFEGGRRITYALYGLAGVCGLFYTFYGGDNAIHFETDSPYHEFHITAKPCRYADGSRFIGQPIEVAPKTTRFFELCFRADEGGRIPYNKFTMPLKLPNSKTIPMQVSSLAPRSVPAVGFYMDNRQAAFERDYSAVEVAKRHFQRIRLQMAFDRFVEAAPWVFFFWVVVKVLAATMGWIARGFAGTEGRPGERAQEPV